MIFYCDETPQSGHLMWPDRSTFVVAPRTSYLAPPPTADLLSQWPRVLCSPPPACQPHLLVQPVCEVPLRLVARSCPHICISKNSTPRCPSVRLCTLILNRGDAGSGRLVHTLEHV